MSDGATDATFWIGIGVLFVLVLGGGALVFWARRNAKSPDAGPAPGFTLEDLRRLYERGEISKREFETARDAMIHRTRESARRERERRGGSDWATDGESGRPGRR